MQKPFFIFFKAIGIYALLTLPALIVPPLYVMSLLYVLSFGWFAWAAFSVFYVAARHLRIKYYLRILILIVGIPIAVLFSFHMIGVLNGWDNPWQSGGFLLFPFAAILSGWTSLATYATELSSSAWPEKQTLKPQADENSL